MAPSSARPHHLPQPAPPRSGHPNFKAKVEMVSELARGDCRSEGGFSPPQTQLEGGLQARGGDLASKMPQEHCRSTGGEE